MTVQEESAFEHCFSIINKLASDLEAGSNIKYKEVPKRLCFEWESNNQIFVIRLFHIKSLNKLYLNHIMSFIRNEKSAIETRNILNKINNLKAFI